MKCLLEDAAAFTGNTDIDLEGTIEMASDRMGDDTSQTEVHWCRSLSSND